jgi:hypothetical protein
MDIVNQVRLSKSENAYDMVEVIESACDYSLDDEDGVTVNPRSKSPLSKTQASLANYGSI